MSVNFPQLRAFLAVVEAGGFGAAADELGVSQSAVSHAVAALERELGGPLLVRAAPARPTVLGRRALPHARAALAAVGALERIAADGEGALRGTVRLAATPTVRRGLLPDLLRHWRAELPGVTVRVFEGDSGELADWLESGTADAAVLVDPPPGPGLALATDGYRALLPRDHPLANEPRLALADLADDPFLVSPDGCEERVRDLHAPAGVPFAPARRVRDLATLIGMVQAGLGVTVLPEASRPLIGPDLVLLPLDPPAARRLVLSGPRSGPWHPAVRPLATAAAEHLAGERPAGGARPGPVPAG
ncbi:MULTISPECIES: LysR family transcriptional regulator [Streptomyces]|uniref:LysR family transcriptional regulator n=1 Tax=Streptomyces ramulosus TaxID=47762 RepID=A0ABW1FBH7_9ACTN